MADYRTDEEQIEYLKKWWNENGKSVVGGIAIGLIMIFGWRGWQNHLVTQGKKASDLYERMIVDEDENEEKQIGKIAQQISDDYKPTPYLGFTKLLQAREAVENNDVESAKNHLQWVFDNTDSDEFKHLARLRLARLLLEEGNKDAALSLIEKIDTGKFAPNYHELRGDILSQQGESKAARDAYTQALGIRDNQPLVQMKLDDIGRN